MKITKIPVQKKFLSTSLNPPPTHICRYAEFQNFDFQSIQNIVLVKIVKNIVIFGKKVH